MGKENWSIQRGRKTRTLFEERRALDFDTMHPGTPLAQAFLHRSAPLLRWRRQIAHALVIAFCIFHMFSVAIAAIPDLPGDPFARIRSYAPNVVWKYIMAASVVQVWNAFAPYPPMSIDNYVVQAETPSGWKDVHTVSTDALPWWQFDMRLKLVQQSRYRSSDGTLLKRYLEVICREVHLAEGTHVKLVFRDASLPNVRSPGDTATWKQWKPAYTRTDGPDVICPASPTA
jgi:hypothetical protein